MRNALDDFKPHFFAQLKRLVDEELSSEDLNKEIDRAKAITGVASQVINNAELVLKAKIAYDEADRATPKPKMLEG